MTTVSASLNYASSNSAEPLYIYYFQPPAGTPFSNIDKEPRQVDVTDVRSCVDAPTIAREGLQFVRHDSRFTQFEDDDIVRERYFPEVRDMVRDLVGGERIVYWNHAMRRPDHGTPVADNVPLAGTRRRPLEVIHGDLTLESLPDNIRQAVGDEAESLMKMRCRFFNFWRPIRGPLTDRPLALCDVTTVAGDDPIPVRLIVESGENEIFAYRYNPAHRWFYLSGMEAGEGVLFSSFDSSDSSSVRRIVPHTAFQDPAHAKGGIPRHSFEMRVIVFG